MGRPRRNNRSKTAQLAVAADAVATTSTSTKSKRMKKALPQRPIKHNDDDDEHVSTTMNHDTDDEELKIYNEQIRYSEAMQFLQQQRERLEARLDRHHHSPPSKETATGTTTTTNGRTQLTRGMLYTLYQLQTQSCTCPLCHGIYVQPITLVSCTHTFCKACIHQHTDQSWYCPSTLQFTLYCVCVCDLYFLCIHKFTASHSIVLTYSLTNFLVRKQFHRANYQFR